MGNPDADMSNGKSTMYSDDQMPLLFLKTTTEPWSVGLCDCFSDCGRCCISCWCPFITFGQVSEIVDRGSSSCGANGGLYFVISVLTGWGFMYSWIYRSKMRQVFNLKGGAAQDCLVHCCCEPCALTQMYRELQNRGFDLSLGWHGNVERQTRGVAAMEPPTKQVGMNR